MYSTLSLTTDSTLILVYSGLTVAYIKTSTLTHLSNSIIYCLTYTQSVRGTQHYNSLRRLETRQFSLIVTKRIFFVIVSMYVRMIQNLN